MDKNFSEMRVFTILICIALCINMITATYSVGYYHTDEYSQIIEFFNYKRKHITADKLPIEFSKEMRPWLQPFLYFISYSIFIKPFSIVNPFVIATFFRFESMFFSFLSQIFFLLVLKKKIFDKKKFLFISGFALLFWPTIFLNSRTSSENISSAFLVSGSAFLMLFINSQNKKNILLFCSAILYGFAFQSRYQSAFFIIGIACWLFLFNTDKIKNLANFTLSLVIPSIICLFIDHWGYGHFVFPYYNYFVENIIHKMAAGFGISPWYAYIPWYNEYLSYGIGIPFLLFFAYEAYISRRHPLIWGIIFFIFSHSIVAHKEVRFLFPIIFIAAIFVFIRFYDFLICTKQITRYYFQIFVKLLLISFVASDLFLVSLYAVVPADKSVADLQYLQEQIPAMQYISLSSDLQCDMAGDSSNNYCALKRYFYLIQDKKLIHPNNMEELIQILKLNPKQEQYVYLKSYLFLDYPSYLFKKCTVINTSIPKFILNIISQLPYSTSADSISLFILKKLKVRIFFKC